MKIFNIFILMSVAQPVQNEILFLVYTFLRLCSYTKKYFFNPKCGAFWISYMQNPSNNQNIKKWIFQSLILNPRALLKCF